MLAFITGSGFYDMDGFSPGEHATRFGPATLLSGEIEGRPVLLLPRHGRGHRHLPHHIPHRAHMTALKEAGATAVVSCSVCGIVNPDWEIGTPLLAEDLWFPGNRLGDGSACTVFDRPGEPGRGHLLAGSFFHRGLSGAVAGVFRAAGLDCPEGCYAHGEGPRFNSRAEIRSLRAAGVDFLSQTCGPEAVLANELELPYALAGFGVDFANGVRDEPTPVEVLRANLERAREAFVGLMRALAAEDRSHSFENFVYRFE